MSARITLTLLLMLAVGGCSAWFAPKPKYLPSEPVAAPEAPYACAEDFPQRSEPLMLSPTSAPTPSPKPTKGAPLRYANTLFVDRLVDHLGRLTAFDNGWSSYALRVRSEGAHSLSARLTKLQLPAGSEVWWCAPGGSLRQGPFKEASKGELWTPVVTGDEAWLEIFVPSRKRNEFQATLAEVHAGFR